MNILLIVLNTGALLAVLGITIERLNIMSHQTTRLPLRIAYVTLSVGACAALWDPPSWAGVLLNIGVCAVLWTDARKPFCYQPDRECGA